MKKSNKKHFSVLSLSLILIFLSVISGIVSPYVHDVRAAEKLYVDSNGPDSEDNDGDHYFRHIQRAIDAADQNDEIVVSPGTYQENINFLGKAVLLKSTDPNDLDIVATTIIDGNQAGSVVTFNNGEDNDSVITGFMIKNGNSFAGGGICCDCFSSPYIRNCILRENSSSYGGGIDCYDYSSPTITHCTISDNSSEDGGGISCSFCSSPNINNCIIKGNTCSNGGGIECFESSSPIISDCIINGNTSISNGGGIECFDRSSPHLTNCTISNNSGDWGGGICCDSHSSPTLTNCTIDNNLASSGGGIECYDFSSPTISSCLISENVATENGGGIYYDTSAPIIMNCIITGNSGYWGGGIYCYKASSSQASIVRCTIKNNLASGDGGGIYCNSSLPGITNCVITKNSAFRGGGISCNYTSSPNITNCTINKNTASLGGGIDCYDSSIPVISNCILWEDLPDEINGNPIVRYSNIKDGHLGTENIDTDPLFIDPNSDDYHLQACSACINTATSEGAPDIDKDGNPRPFGTGYDMGAYEFLGTPCEQAEIEVQISLPAGWSMVSLPVKPDDLTASALFPAAKAIYGFDKNSGYIPVAMNQALKVGNGYWMLVTEASTYTVKGVVVENYTLPLVEGWSMIGSCSSSAKAFSDNDNIQVIYDFDRDFGYKRLLETDNLKPGRGYWILLKNTNNQGQLLVKSIETLSNE